MVRLVLSNQLVSQIENKNDRLEINPISKRKVLASFRFAILNDGSCLLWGDLISRGEVRLTSVSTSNTQHHSYQAMFAVNYISFFPDAERCFSPCWRPSRADDCPSLDAAKQNLEHVDSRYSLVMEDSRTSKLVELIELARLEAVLNQHELQCSTQKICSGC